MAARALAENRHRAMIAAVYLPVLVAKVRGTHIPPQLRSCRTLPYHRDSSPRSHHPPCEISIPARVGRRPVSTTEKPRP